ncbi:MAG: twin-arginine translocase subunit TatC [bacterium]
MQDDNNATPVPEQAEDAAIAETGIVPAEAAAAAPAKAAGGAAEPPPELPGSEKGNDEEDEEEGMLRMSFLEHLEELRSRIIKSLMGIGVAFICSLVFANQMWVVVSEPVIHSLKELGYTPQLAITKPMESFSIVWIKLPMLAAIFLASPWVLYQVWAFIAPGLYKRERRWAAPFVICSAGLFITGGLFAYFVALRFGLTFLLGIGRNINIMPVVTITEYFDLFINVMLGVGIVFELPVLVFFLTLLRIVSPAFLVRNSRYAILAIVTLAAVITPTPDIFNLMMFVVPMLVLFFVGVFASYLLVLHRENRRFPWLKLLYVLVAFLVALVGAMYVAVVRYGYHLVPAWPYLTK